jgi:twitching motility protein PilI
VTRVPGARGWIARLLSERSRAAADRCIDLKAILGGNGETQDAPRHARVIVVNHRELPAGLVVDEVLGFRRFPEASRVDAPGETELRCGRYLAGAFVQGEATWPVFSFNALSENPSFLRAAEDD